MKKRRFGDLRDEMQNPPCTMPARQRDGKAYPGGRPLRRAMGRLKGAQSAFNGKQGYRLAGAMKP